MLQRALGAAAIAAAVFGCLTLSGPVSAQSDNVCDPGEAPDVIVGDLTGVSRHSYLNGVASFSFGTTSCNIGTCGLNWISDSSQHPVIAQNMFRLKDGRFEQIGQSWLKHGFFALSNELCDTGCLATSGTQLGVNCSDPYSAFLNGLQSGLGPKFEVDASSGSFPWPPTDIDQTGDGIYKRLQVHGEDLDPALNPGASYFVEGQYVTADDAAAGNDTNNASFRTIDVFVDGQGFNFSLTGETQRELAAIQAWPLADPSVTLREVDVPADGRFILASTATPLGHGYWQYEYAVHNLNSSRSGGSFSVPIPSGADVVGIGFHDVDYHSGEPYGGTDWNAVVTDDGVGPADVSWSTQTFGENPNANALRWGTLYNFRFSANVPPQTSDVTVGLFRPGTPAGVATALPAPEVCDNDGVCEPGEDCSNCAGDCVTLGDNGFCGDGFCELEIGEDCTNCAADCSGEQGGNPGNRYCCGAGGGTNPIDCDDSRCTTGGFQCADTLAVDCCGDGVCDAGEDPCGCSADCGPCFIGCSGDPECDDGVFCNGAEVCSGGQCQAGTPACSGQLCDEALGSCLDCIIDEHCDDGDFCNGEENCSGELCQLGIDPCPGLSCNEEEERCVECFSDGDCDDGIFCNGSETCSGESCLAGVAPCQGEDFCDDLADVCVACTTSCDDGVFCNGEEVCMGDSCFGGAEACPGQACDEEVDACIGTVALQPRMGQPLFGLSAAEQARFDAGRAAFDLVFDEAAGLGPAFNDTSCAACHNNPTGGSGALIETRFGFEDVVSGAFDPLTSMGGSLLQSAAIDPQCEETIPPVANTIGFRVTTSTLGAGMVEAILDSDIEARALMPPGNVSGRVHNVEALEDPGISRVGRFGWKSQEASLLSFSANAANGEMGITNRLAVGEQAPNGDPGLLAICDSQPDPEDGPDLDGFDFIDRVTDFQRFLAPPPRTPRSGMLGAFHFATLGCANCHVQQFTTPSLPSLPAALRGKSLQPYSDFLLHDMGDSGDGIGQGDAGRNEMRTAPLWGVRTRTHLWHDGSVAGGTFTDRILAAVALHDAPGSEAQSSALQFSVQPIAVQNALIRFLDSLGRAEFDHDGDNDVDLGDWLDFQDCMAATGTVSPEDPCAVSDVDQDGDVDADDYALFVVAFAGEFGGRVPDGVSVPGQPLRVERSAGGEITLSWDASCASGDADFEVYEGSQGDFTSHQALLCSTAGATSASITPGTGDRYYLVVPTNGTIEGSYGVDRSGVERPPAVGGFACRDQAVGGCP